MLAQSHFRKAGEPSSGWDPERGEIIWGLPEASGGFGLDAVDQRKHSDPRPYLLAETPPHKNAITRTYPGTTKDQGRRRYFLIEIELGDVQPECGLRPGSLFLLGTTRLHGTGELLNRYVMRPATSAGSTAAAMHPRLTAAGLSKLEKAEERLRGFFSSLCSNQGKGGKG